MLIMYGIELSIEVGMERQLVVMLVFGNTTSRGDGSHAIFEAE